MNVKATARGAAIALGLCAAPALGCADWGIDLHSTYLYDKRLEAWEQCPDSGWYWYQIPNRHGLPGVGGASECRPFEEQVAWYKRYFEGDDLAKSTGWLYWLERRLEEYRAETGKRKVHGRTLQRWWCKKRG